VALAVLFKMAARGEIQQKDRVIIISTANGLKFTDFKVDYHEDRLEDVTARYNHQPVELPARYDDVARVLDKMLGV